ncbi:hypothetical protein EDB89DRAFT_2080246 [Lactarius sanguifluus]|nr:hypothetical protein EDB89DRAFT_2080246 [Lactarius sanguifluus]
MSQPPLASASPYNFESIFRTAVQAYKKRTGRDITSHPLASWFKTCDSPDAILAVLQAQVQEFDQSRRDDERLTKWLNPTVNVLYAFSATLGEGVGLVFSPAKVIFAGIGVLLLASRDVAASHDVLVDIFKRLEAYTEIPQTAAMTDVIIKIMVEVLSIFAIATKEIKQGRANKHFKKLRGRRDIEDAFQRLDKLTQEEARMATAEVLRLTQNVGDEVKGIGDQVEGVNTGVQGVDREVQAVDDRVRVVDDNVKLILNVALSPDPSINYNTAGGAYHKSTATWFTRCDIFNGWGASGGLLWVHGKPGSGKSILSSVIIQDMDNDTGKQDPHALLSSLLIQLSDQSDVYCDILLDLYSTHRQGSVQPNDDALTQCLKTMLVALGKAPIYLIVDALDECPNTSGMPSPRERLLRLVKDLVELKLSNLRLCVTSRPEIDIRIVLEPLAPLRISLHDESGQKTDIANYVSSVVYSDSRMRRWRAKERDLVVRTLSEKADGMFRWVFCQLEVLRHCFPSSVLQILEELPESLDETYEHILKGINKANRANAYRLLQCLTVAVRPLRVEELAEVMAVDFNARGVPKLNADWRWEDQEEAVLSACSSLVVVIDNGHSRVVQFSYFSVKEFLTSNRLATSSLREVSRFHIRLESAHTILAQASLGVLLRLDEQVNRDNITGFPLARYAAEYWIDHVEAKNVLSYVKDGIDHLFNPDKPHLAAWIWLSDVDRPWRVGRPWRSGSSGTGPAQPDAPPLYYAVRTGHRALVEHVLSGRPQDVNAKGGHYGTVLHAAVSQRDVKVVWLLLENGADVNNRGIWDQTPLHRASVEGLTNVVRWLLDRGVDVNAQQDNPSTALLLAALNGRLEVAEILLEHNAEVNAGDQNDQAPLHKASEGRNLELVRLLLKHGGNANARDKKGRTPFDLAKAEGNAEIIRLLSEYVNE